MKKRIYVYLVSTVKDGKEVGPCKIGISTNLSGRLKMLQCGSANKLTFRQIWNPACLNFEARMVETQTHRALAKYRLSGEWFDFPPEDLEYVIDFALAHAFKIEEEVTASLAKEYVARARCLGRTHDSAGRQMGRAA